MRRAARVGIAVAVVAALAGSPAQAAVTTVDVGTTDPAAPSDDVFVPASVTIAAGDSVNWGWRSGTHSVTADAGQGDSFDSGVRPTSPNQSFQHAFSRPGTFTYYCIPHRDIGMRGTVTVIAPASPPASPPLLTGPPAVTPVQPLAAADSAAPTIRGLRANLGTRCARRSRACTRPGLSLAFRLSETAALSAQIARVLPGRAPRLVRSIQLAGRSGANRARVSLRGLKPGRYRLTLRATDAAGDSSPAASAVFRLRRS